MRHKKTKKFGFLNLFKDKKNLDSKSVSDFPDKKQWEHLCKTLEIQVFDRNRRSARTVRK